MKKKNTVDLAIFPAGKVPSNRVRPYVSDPEHNAMVAHQSETQANLVGISRRLFLSKTIVADAVHADDPTVSLICGIVEAMKVCKRSGLACTIFTEHARVPWLIGNIQYENVSMIDLSESDKEALDNAAEWLRRNPDHTPCEYWDSEVYGDIQHYFMGDSQFEGQ